MRFKVSDKVKTKGDEWFNKGEIVEIIEVDKGDPRLPYRCKGNTAVSWEFDADLEPLDRPPTFQQKLDRFKREPIGFLVKSKEIADELAKVLDNDSNFKDSDGYTWKSLCTGAFNIYGNKAYVCYSGRSLRGSSDQLISGSLQIPVDELLELTLEELKSYNAPQTLEDKLKLFKAGTHVLYTPTQEIYDKLMVELEKRGYVWVTGDNMTGRSFAAEAKGRTDLCIQYNGFGNGKVNSGYIKYRKEAGLEILTLTPGDFSTPQVITITTDGYHRTTAESNGVTAESLCCPTDTFSLTNGSHMALQRLLEKVKECTVEEPEFCVGDIVEIMGTDADFLKESIGLQGVILRIGEYGRDKYLVELPVAISGDNKWLYDNLKLIRRVNV